MTLKTSEVASAGLGNIGSTPEGYELSIEGLDGGQIQFGIHCRACGGCEMTLRDDPGDMAMAHCKACGAWLARLGRIRLDMIMMARAAGYLVDEAAAELIAAADAAAAAAKTRRQ